jgi:hypothetical protein
MGVREKLAANPRAVITIAAAIVVISLGVIYFQWQAGDSGRATPRKMFLTVDDGTTFFVGAADPLPPFQHEGRTAYRAYVFTCDGGKTTWVGYVERYSEQAKALLKEMQKSQAERGGAPSVPPGLLDGIEVSRPGENQWVRQSDAALAHKVTSVYCPNAPDKDADLVLP